MLDTLIKLKLFIVIYNTKKGTIFTKIKKKKMQENSKECELSIKIALDNAKKRIILLDDSDKKCVIDEYKEWINEGSNNHRILVLREDPII